MAPARLRRYSKVLLGCVCGGLRGVPGILSMQRTGDSVVSWPTADAITWASLMDFDELVVAATYGIGCEVQTEGYLVIANTITCLVDKRTEDNATGPAILALHRVLQLNRSDSIYAALIESDLQHDPFQHAASRPSPHASVESTAIADRGVCPRRRGPKGRAPS